MTDENSKLTSCAIVCTYNGEKYIGEQLDSIINQSKALDKILIFDDRSKDNTPQILKEYSEKYPQLIEFSVNEKNCGYIKNFENALNCARNFDIVFFSDQDDVWYSEKAETILKEFQNDKKVVLVFTDGDIVDSKLNPINNGQKIFDLSFNYDKEKIKAFNKNPRKLLTEGGCVTGATMAIRNTIIDGCIPFEKTAVHDEWIAALASYWGKVVRLEKPLIKYRQHENNQLGIKLRITKEDVEPVPNGNFIQKFLYSVGQKACNKISREMNLKKDMFNEFFAEIMKPEFSVTQLDPTDENYLMKLNILRKAKFFDINKRLKLMKYKKDRTDFLSGLVSSFNKNPFSRFWFFIKNTLNGNYKNNQISFNDSVRYIFIRNKNK